MEVLQFLYLKENGIHLFKNLSFFFFLIIFLFITL